MRAFTDTGNGGSDGPKIRFLPSADARTVKVRLDTPDGVTMRRVDLARLHAWLGDFLGTER